MAGESQTIGVLALQGGFEAHERALGRLGCTARRVTRTAQLDALDGLVLPGGESTTLLNLMRDEPWFDALRAFHARGGGLLATCAGTILLANEVRGPSQPSIGLLDAVVERNAYGRQVDSFETELAVTGEPDRAPAIFIRAPAILELGSGVETLASHAGRPVLVRQGELLAATFHPELTDDPWLHRRFVASLHDSAATAPRARRAIMTG